MVDVHLSPRAERDFIDIGYYTREQWSAIQAETYLSQILHIISQIGERPLSGQTVRGIKSGYRRRRAGVHLIFYATNSDGSVEIIRILHEKSDALHHLGFD
ncbi:type II toxin-antitoxin system RelE/ParE family toxin [Neorhizobium sp. JUb45]|uniref:type II toxin-antitoxin system RelE/ParE family toxin n=1 Tax=unclassified Neorhizobium TaxID=2629175 RepID=UPI0010EC76CD|nr:type II toxin-antitoxin system RelE/ParE family toxin [Neorhizobium sp. JUb45]TCR04186.1 toxin ParE1/3/4 [Neorhizobium sp. JUb45]